MNGNGIPDPRAAVSTSVGESDYIGWVVYIDGSPIFQTVAANSRLKQLHHDAYYYADNRAENNNTVEWRNLPQNKIERFELYAFRKEYTEQPIFRIDKEPGSPEVRFACMQMAAVAVSAGGQGGRGQERTGLAGFKVGWYNPTSGTFDLWEITPRGRKKLSPHGGHRDENAPDLVGHPCWPKPLGFGIAPIVFGLTDSDVPERPSDL